MYVTRVSSKLSSSTIATAQVPKAVLSFFTQTYTPSTTHNPGLHHAQPLQTRRSFTSLKSVPIKGTECFPEPEHDGAIRKTDPAWHHPGYCLFPLSTLAKTNGHSDTP